jgi:hypothetical protein
MGPAFCRQFSMPFARRSGTLARCLSVYLALEAGKLLDGLNPNVPSLRVLFVVRPGTVGAGGNAQKGRKLKRCLRPATSRGRSHNHGNGSRTTLEKISRYK